jgi:hypothetical protein
MMLEIDQTHKTKNSRQMMYSDWDNKLKERFPGYGSHDRDQAWEELKRQLVVGQSVTGVIVTRAPFGAWIDLGIGFPALLEIICIDGLTPERYRAGDWCPIGSEVTAFVGDFTDRSHQIRLFQVKPS